MGKAPVVADQEIAAIHAFCLGQDFLFDLPEQVDLASSSFIDRTLDELGHLGFPQPGVGAALDGFDRGQPGLADAGAQAFQLGQEGVNHPLTTLTQLVSQGDRT